MSQTVQVVDHASEEMLSSGEEMITNVSEIASAIGQMSSGAQNQVLKVDESFTVSRKYPSQVLMKWLPTLNLFMRQLKRV